MLSDERIRTRALSFARQVCVCARVCRERERGSCIVTMDAAIASVVCSKCAACGEKKERSRECWSYELLYIFLHVIYK